jgi:hypothetical protein
MMGKRISSQKNGAIHADHPHIIKKIVGAIKSLIVEILMLKFAK